MAKGDLTIFEEFALSIGLEKMQLNTDTLKLGLITTAAASVAASTASPTWSDFSASEVSGSGYSAGGATIASNSYVEAAGVGTLDGNDVTWSQNASGFTNARTGIVYDDTPASAASKVAICKVDLGSSSVSLQDGDVTVSWNSSGILTITVS
jgi:hypothetical protein